MSPRPRIRKLAPLLVAMSAMLLSGCYEHVVSVKGPGRDSYDVYEPHFNEQEEKDIANGIDEFFGNLFGQKKETDKRR